MQEELGLFQKLSIMLGTFVPKNKARPTCYLGEAFGSKTQSKAKKYTKLNLSAL